MPIHSVLIPKPNTKIAVWKITETLDFLISEITLTPTSQQRLNGMKSESHQKGFLAVRMALQVLGYTDTDLYYSENGKPHLKDKKNISITHSFNFSVVIVSEEPVGIDIEWCRDKVQRIEKKFVHPEEFFYPKNDYLNTFLTVIWGVKESVYKMYGEKGLSFLDHIKVNPFDLREQKGIANVDFLNEKSSFVFHFRTIENFVLVFTFNS